MAIGLSVPGASDLGLGSTLQSQVQSETDEQRKKRMMQEAQAKLLGMTPGASQIGLGSYTGI